jgi:hypothetical protein
VRWIGSSFLEITGGLDEIEEITRQRSRLGNVTIEYHVAPGVCAPALDFWQREFPSSCNRDKVVYGKEPVGIAAQPRDPVKIFAVTIRPSVWRSGSIVVVNATTTANATRASLTYDTTSVALAEISPGHWAGSFSVANSALPSGQRLLTATVTATRIDGIRTQVPLVVKAMI